MSLSTLRSPATLLIAVLALPTCGHAQLQLGEEAAALAVADSAIAALSRSDFVALTDLMLDSAVVNSAGLRGGQAGQWGFTFSSRAQVRATPRGENLTERGFGAMVNVSGPLAMVWLPYDLYVDGKWSNGGVNAFTLLKSDGGWRIASLAFSVEQPPACARHPDGPPPRR